MAKSPKLRPSPAPGAIKGGLPVTQGPQLCSLVIKAPDTDDWLVEVKFDGYRIIASCIEVAGQPRPIELGAMPAVLHSSVS